MGAANVCTNVNIYVDICDKAAAVWDYLHLLSGDEECSDFTRSPTVLVQECERFSCLTVPTMPRVTAQTDIVLHDCAETSVLRFI